MPTPPEPTSVTEPMLLDERYDCGDLRLATDERAELQRQVVRKDVERAQRRKVCSKAGREQLIDLLRAREVFEPMRAQIAQACLWWKRALHEISRDTRDEHLAAVADRQQPRDAVERRAEVIALVALLPCRCEWPCARKWIRRSLS